MLGGVAIGLASNLSPMYIAEVAPAPMRGRLVVDQPAHHRHRHPAAQFINWLLVRDLPAGRHATSSSAPRGTARRAGAGCSRLTAVPSLLFFVSMFFVPESPRWLVKNGRPRPRPRRPGADRRRRPTPTAAMAEIEGHAGQRGIQHVRLRATCSSRGCGRCWCWAWCWPCSSSGAAST